MKVAQSCLTLCDPMDYTVQGILQARILECEAFPFSRGSSQPMIDPRSPALQADSLPAEPQGKPKNTEVGSLSLLQWIFLTQELNWVTSWPTELSGKLRSKHLLISWLQSPFEVILEPKKIKSFTVSIVSPPICHEVMGLDAMILVFWMLSFNIPAFPSPLSLSLRGSLVPLGFLP